MIFAKVLNFFPFILMALVLGAGKQGIAIAHDLIRNGMETRICDAVAKNLPNFFLLDVKNEDKLREEMRKEDVVISALPYDFNYRIAKIAIETKCHFLDLGGNTFVVEREMELHEEAKRAGVTIIPDCGLAPGMTNVIASHLYQKGCREIHIRVGGLPQKPSPPLNYALFFSVHGLINEYIEDSIIVRNGEIMEMESLTGLEKIEFDGFPPLEAFFTHGGTSTLPLTLKGIKNLDYKTIRYEGHAEKMMMLKKLGFFDEEARSFTEKILEKALPKDFKDVVLARVYGDGITMEMVDYHDGAFSAMQRTTGFSTAIMAKMVLDGYAEKGVYPPELAIDSEKFMREAEKRNIVWKMK